MAAGLAAYFGWDITLVRISDDYSGVCALLSMIILYVIGWLVIPEARTAAEKLSMRGEAVTIENIGKTVTDGFERVADGVNNYVNSGKPLVPFFKDRRCICFPLPSSLRYFW